MNTFIEPVFRTLLAMSWQAGVILGLILVVQIAFRKWLSPAARSGLWLIFMLRLLLPVSIPSPVSVHNYVRVNATEFGLRAIEPMPTAASKPEAASALFEPQVAPYAPAHSPVSGHTIEVAEPAPAPAPQAPESAAAPPAIAPRELSPGIETTPKPAWSVWQAASVVWFAGLCLLTVRALVRRFAFQWRLKRGRIVEDIETAELLKECAELIGLKRSVEIREMPEMQTPAVAGILKPVLLLPEGARTRFDAPQLRLIFLHEMAHLKRRDLWVNAMAGLLQMVHWFNPLVWLAFARMRHDQELATDHLALSVAGETACDAYGETIIQALEKQREARSPIGAIGFLIDRRRLRDRIEAIASFRPQRRWTLFAALAAAVLGVACLTDAQREARQPDDLAAKPDEEPEAKSANDNAPAIESKTLAIHITDWDTGDPIGGAKVDGFAGATSWRPAAQTRRVSSGSGLPIATPRTGDSIFRFPSLPTARRP